MGDEAGGLRVVQEVRRVQWAKSGVGWDGTVRRYDNDIELQGGCFVRSLLSPPKVCKFGADIRNANGISLPRRAPPASLQRFIK